ncbi:unnamed protein product, partial [Rotaria sp. Silwood1]
MPLNWQRENWSGGFVYGQQMPLQPPPFYYPMDNLTMNKSSSIFNGKNQIQGHSVTPHTPRRGILKQTEKWRTPMTRRLVHFMPERWQGQETAANNMTSHEYRGMSITTPIQVNKKGHNSNVVSGLKRSGTKKTPEKAHLDTLRRRERRQRNRAFLLEQSKELDRLSDNRFNLLSVTDDEETDKDLSEIDNEIETMKDNEQRNLSKQEKQNAGTRMNVVSKKRQVKTTTEVLINNEHVVSNKTNTRGNNQHQINVSNPEMEQNNVEQSSTTKDKRKIKTYLQGFKILAYLKGRANNDHKLKFDLKDAFNEVCAYAKNTIETYDKWVHDHYEGQVWQRFYDLGKHKDHWAKEIVNITHTQEAKTNIVLCEKKISHFTSACFDANNIITRNMRELSDTVIANRAHDLMLDYIKEVTQGLSKMSINRIRRASIEKDEWDALKAFENVAPEQQKIYAKTFCKSALKAYEKKKKNFDLVAAHISSYDIIPKILPQDDVFNLLVDENSLSSEQVHDNKENIHKISRDFRLEATELYLKIVKEEFEFDKERLEKLLEDFPQDSDEVLPLTQIVNDEEPFDDEENINNNNDDDEEEEIFTQRPLPPRRK